MASVDIGVIDVGHGSATVVICGDEALLVDAASAETILEILEDHKVREVGALILSHADADHISGAVGLLGAEGVRIRELWLNSDSARSSQVWQDLRHAIALHNQEQRLRAQIGVTTTDSDRLNCDGLVIQVLAPSPETAASGVGGRDLHNRPLTANSMSVVVRLVVDGRPLVVIAGDLDFVGLENLLDTQGDIRAPVLVFPHHGGLPGRDDAFEFAKRLTAAVGPRLIVFSIGRGRHGTPRPEIISGVRDAVPTAHIACTQLSERCATRLGPRDQAHLSRWQSRGRSPGACCAGTVVISVRGNVVTITPQVLDHRAFIGRAAPTALCLRSPDVKATRANT